MAKPLIADYNLCAYSIFVVMAKNIPPFYNWSFCTLIIDVAADSVTACSKLYCR